MTSHHIDLTPLRDEPIYPGQYETIVGIQVRGAHHGIALARNSQCAVVLRDALNALIERDGPAALERIQAASRTSY